MKIKIYLFRFAVAGTTFLFGVGFLSAGQYLKSVFQTKNQETVAIQPAAEHDTLIAPLVLEQSINEQTDPTSDLKESAEEEFYADGDYYIVSKLPKAFADFSEISITTIDDKTASEENNYWGTPIPPKGYILTKKEYKFAQINIANRQIAFQTETKKGISYKFIGSFIDHQKVSVGNDYADLVGHLIKLRDGKKVAETEVRLEAGGC